MKKIDGYKITFLLLLLIFIISYSINSQVGRYQFKEGSSLILDTKTGDVYNRKGEVFKSLK